MTDRMRRIQCIHFVGIGGAGMGGIAEVLLNLGYQIQGSDLVESAVTRRLAALGVSIVMGHDAANVESADVVVVSSAVPQDNPEVVAAQARRCPVVPRAEMLAELFDQRVQQRSVEATEDALPIHEAAVTGAVHLASIECTGELELGYSERIENVDIVIRIIICVRVALQQMG